MLLASFISSVNDGNSIRRQANLSDKTLVGYMNAAAKWWWTALHWEIPLYDPASRLSKQPALHPVLRDVLQERRAWKQPRQQRLPITFLMYEVLHAHIAEHMANDRFYFLTEKAAIFDWMRLGLFTGSRLAEYGQSKPQKGQRFATVPLTSHAGEWAGQPLAFVASDFTLFDDDQVMLSHDECLLHPSRPTFVQVRFRFDKGPTNFALRKWRRVSGSFLCPVSGTISILRRARLLGIPLSEPLGAFRPKAGIGYVFLKGDNVSSVMQWACVLAYPNPDHYMRRHIHLLHSHSNRITAAVAMYNAKVPFDTIAVRLRWSVDTVKFYLRDCFKHIGELTEQAVNGAMLC
jgi:hypothetical protein